MDEGYLNPKYHKCPNAPSAVVRTTGKGWAVGYHQEYDGGDAIRTYFREVLSVWFCPYCGQLLPKMRQVEEME